MQPRREGLFTLLTPHSADVPPAIFYFPSALILQLPGLCLPMSRGFFLQTSGHCLMIPHRFIPQLPGLCLPMSCCLRF